MVAYTEREQPGVMIYWEQVEMLRQLDPQMRSDIFFAGCDYARYGTEPNFEPGVLSALWVCFRDKIDRDVSAYQRKKNAGRNAGLKSAEMRGARAMQTNDCQPPLTRVNDGQRGQPTVSTTSTIPIPSSTASSASIQGADKENDFRDYFLGGDTEKQIRLLEAKLSLYDSGAWDDPDELLYCQKELDRLKRGDAEDGQR